MIGDGTKIYTYSQANRLIAISAAISADGLDWQAAYNGDGARLAQIVNGTATSYTLDLASPLGTQVGAAETAYVYGQGDSPLAGYDGTIWTYCSRAIPNGHPAPRPGWSKSFKRQPIMVQRPSLERSRIVNSMRNGGILLVEQVASV